VPAGAEAATEEKLRRLLRRLELQSSDANLLTGMFRQILWKLHSSEKKPVRRKTRG
jgi:tRNA C32,U32 (ribose-2'-O)-methylase TrmJ